ncbi:hypothetical protein F511_25093 [Dorcoceras hygrometricum]|uniref:Uncharacterized protein n=1 Tax=Dorcoceras hygrometricum TaxID=472368 RepID=A0A2Z7ACA5_9LAMI|nr:hypothetical protein F511_25093 [Dorcoceras hygrometricum]
MFAVRILRPVRVPIAAVFPCPSTRTTPRPGRNDFFKAWMKSEAINSPELCMLSKSIFKSVALRKSCEYAQKLRDSGWKFSVGNTVVCGVLGSIILSRPISYCLEGFHPLADYPQKVSTDSPLGSEIDGIMALVQKLIVPIFLIINLWLNWGHSHPLFLLVKVTLVFLTTKPFPSSVHLVVDRPPKARIVEVQDYTLLCLARVEIKDEKLMLIGILGGWWILPLSSHKEEGLHKSLWMELVSLVKSRFRLAAGIC